MAKLTTNADDKSNESIVQRLDPVMGQVTLTTSPVVICGVQRKANIGNFETIDVYCAVALPTDVANVTDPEELRKALSEAAEEGFKVTSSETHTRYQLIKGSLKQGN